MRTGGILGAFVGALRSVAARTSAFARWSLGPDDEEVARLPPPPPGPPHGPIPAIDLRRPRPRGEVPRSGGVPPI